MSSEDVELIRRLHEAWLAGDRETALAGVHPDIEWVEPYDAPEPETHLGAEGIEESMAEWTAPFEDFSFEIRELRDLGDGLVLARVHQRGRARGSTVPIESTIFHLWTVREGRAARAEMFRTEEEALEAAKRPAKRA
jgi:ketosteroid isomerase-like protein